MYEQLLSQLTTSFKGATGPSQQLAAVAVATVEKLAHFQLQAARSYTDITLAQLRAGLEVKDLQSLQAFLADQQKLAKTLAEKLGKDSRALASLGEEYGAEVQKVLKDNAGALVQVFQVKPSTRKAA